MEACLSNVSVRVRERIYVPQITDKWIENWNINIENLEKNHVDSWNNWSRK